MKKLLFTIVLLFFACNKVNHIPATNNFYAIDFSKYSQEGFLFTPKEYFKAYKSIGLVEVVITAEMNKVKVEDHRGSKQWKSSGLNIYEGLDKMYQQAKEMGADAVMDLDISFNDIERTVHLPSIPRIKLSGFAIKRTD